MINKKSSILSLLVTSLVILVMGSQLVKLEFNNDLDAFFPLKDPDLIYYKSFSEKFGQDNDYVLIAIRNKNGIFDSTFLKKAERFVNDLKEVTYVNKVASLIDLKKVVKSPMGIIEFPFLHIDATAKIIQDSIRIYKEIHIREQFISKDNRATRIIISHEKLTNKKESDLMVDRIYELIDEYSFDQVHLAGRPIGERAYIGAVRKDFTFFVIFSGLTILVMLIIFVRRASMVAIALLISILSVVFTLSFMSWIGKEIDILSTLIPSILLVVSMSDIIHLFSHTREKYLQGLDMSQAINHAVKKVGFATLLTSITTAVGFLTLISIRVKPIIDLGIFSAVGIAAAFVLTYLIFPQALFLIKPKMVKRGQTLWLKKLLHKTYLMVMKRQKTILVAFGIAALLVFYGISRLEINAFLIDDLPKNDPVKDDFLYFDQQFGGTKPFTMSIWTTDSSEIYTPKTIMIMDSIERLAQKTLQANHIISPVTLVKSVHQMYQGGRADQYALPQTDRQWRKVFRFIKKEKLEDRSIKVTDGNTAQISGFAMDLGSKDANDRSELFVKQIDDWLDKKVLDYKITGSSQLIEKSHETLSMNLMKGLFTAVIIVCIIAGYMFHSWRMILITLIPNLFPIVTVAAVMGYFGIPINLGTSIIFAISFGIVVDDTIHFLSKLREERLEGRSMIYALKNTIMATGEPIVITTLILTAGFVIFCFSNFAATFNTGLFVSVSFIVALIADLTLLPVLILIFLPRRNLKSKSSN